MQPIATCWKRNIHLHNNKKARTINSRIPSSQPPSRLLQTNAAEALSASLETKEARSRTDVAQNTKGGKPRGRRKKNAWLETKEATNPQNKHSTIYTLKTVVHLILWCRKTVETATGFESSINSISAGICSSNSNSKLEQKQTAGQSTGLLSIPFYTTIVTSTSSALISTSCPLPWDATTVPDTDTEAPTPPQLAAASNPGAPLETTTCSKQYSPHKTN